jgi:hypothetical protein
MDRVKLRASLIKLMLGCLIAAAAVAIVTILVGKYSDTTGRSLGTVFSALLHIAIVFGLVSVTTAKSDPLRRSADFVLNASILIAVASFFTSVFGIWGMLSGDLAGKLYLTYVVALFALVHVKTLIDATWTYPKVQPYAVANYVFIGVVAFMILGVVYTPDGSTLIETFYGRLLAACAIVDVTLSVIVAVMQRLYVQQHPEIAVEHPNRAHGGIRAVFLALLFFFVVLPMLQLILGFVLWAR